MGDDGYTDRKGVAWFVYSGDQGWKMAAVTSITVGTNNQFVSTQAAGTYAGDVNVELSACTSALDIAVNYSIHTAP